MAWTAPRTWVAGELVSAALLNTHVRDNLLETAVAKSTVAGDLTYATAANALARLGIGSSGFVLESTGGVPAWRAQNMGVIFSTTLGSAAASVAISGISTSWANLMLVASIRGTDAGASVAGLLQLNSDNSTNYDYQRLNVTAGTVSGAVSVGSTAARLGIIPAAGSTSAKMFSPVTVMLTNYASTVADKFGLVQSGVKIGLSTATEFGLEELFVAYRSTAAISAITVYPLSGSLSSGSRVTLYGLP